MRAGAVVLAAGAATRFGGNKLAAPLAGRPVLRHVIDAAVEAGLDPIIVVGPPDDRLRDVRLQPARIVVNDHPEDGLSSSVRLGLRALDDDGTRPSLDAAVLLQGDQPLVRASTIRALLAAAEETPGVPFVVARHAADRSPNPVVARRSTWRLADELAGDRGFGPLLATHDELVRFVAIEGDNPDVDTPADLARLRDTAEPPADVS
ncbi:MAG TPA: nucleotidyltransferase family protein [Candidatus Limnocylindrales bacterium]|nr:nucleotidyltransferase family protein [Candidatus Limnocylindrales bacterium]